ncbi:MAG: Maf family protein [Ruminococcus flavefaciens]|nr:Maf family protein [Ruminococcus flavefaciens]MCM1229748.1 Maf family protein [Ruminococcus flavefaciens]
MRIILASASPRRRELISVITDGFTAVSADVDETIPDDTEPLRASEYLAEIKAKAVSRDFPQDIVIGCDTTVICGNRILGKPADKDECREFMRMLSGRTHQVATGCCIICNGIAKSFTEITDVTFRRLSDEEIEEYISTAEPYDKAGGYGIQGRASLLVEKINGDYFNVVGLPVSRLNQELKKFYKEFLL